MLHYKVFTSEMTRGDFKALEEMVNTWLEETHPLVHTMAQSPCGSGIVLSFLYEIEEEQAEHTAVATAEVAERVTIAQPQPADTLMITLMPQMELPY